MFTSIIFIATAMLSAKTVSSAPAPVITPGVATPNGTAVIESVRYTTTSSSIIIPTTVYAPASTAVSGLTLFQQLLLAPTAAERQSLLTDDQFVFNFADPSLVAGVTKGDGGKTVRADHLTFPALVGSGGSITVGFLGPCGFNTPHVHPRAAELNLVVQGRLFTSATPENGARHLNHTLNTWEMTIFPAGALHTEFNLDCTDAIFVAAFPSEDPGVGQMAQEFYGLEDNIVNTVSGGEVTVNGADIDIFRSRLPANVAKGVDSCLAKCGIAKR